MKKLFLAAVAISALSIGSTAAIADNHGGEGHKGKMMEKVDTNGDGMISKDEFMAKHESKFTKMDVDGNGSLSKDEMKDARGKMKDKMNEMKDKMKEMKSEY